LVPLSVARRNVRTSALTPAESQNVVVLMSAISADAPWLIADSSCSRISSAIVTSISAGSVATATWPSHSTLFALS
jgi:hypothetical protein